MRNAEQQQIVKKVMQLRLIISDKDNKEVLVNKLIVIEITDQETKVDQEINTVANIVNML
eukprot:2033296-Heterocapsa_arctica.AAC.1